MLRETTCTVSNIATTISYANEQDAPVSEHEIQAYIDRAYQQYPARVLQGLKLEVEGEDVGINYVFDAAPFDRIRRITGYLVGTMDRWNDAKTHEEADRVKHGVAVDGRVPTCANGC